MSMTSPNGGINPRQNFVQPGQQNTGAWLGKIFGGIARNRQARDYTQMRADLMLLNHDLSKEQLTHKAALEDFGADQGAKRARKETAWHDKQNTRNEIWKEKEIGKAKEKGITVNSSNIDRNAGFDRNGMPIRQKRSQVTYPGSPNSNNTANTTVTDNSGKGNPPPPPGGGAAAASKPTRAKKATATKKTGATSAGGLNPLNDTEAADTNKRASINGDGGAPSANAPAVVAPKVTKPRTKKAGA
jgi:hypothetical protein